MATELTTQISGLVETNPTSTDPVSKGDNHIRMIKNVLKLSFPSDIQVHIPDTAGQDGKFLRVDGTYPIWEDPIDWRATMAMAGAYMRSKFSYVDSTHIRIWPGSYDVSGVGTVNLDWSTADSPIDMSVADSVAGWNYIYIDQSEASSALSADPYARLAITEATAADLLGHSNTRPLYNPMKRGFYINEEDRVIFAYYWDGSAMRKFHHDGGSYVHYDAGLYVGSKTSNGWQTFTASIPPIGDHINGQFTFNMRTPGGSSTLGSSFYARTTGETGQHFLGSVEHGTSEYDNEHNTSNLHFTARSTADASQIDVYKSGGSGGNVCDISVNGFYLPNGI